MTVAARGEKKRIIATAKIYRALLTRNLYAILPSIHYRLATLPTYSFATNLNPPSARPARNANVTSRWYSECGIKCIGNYVYPLVFVEVKYFLSRSILSIPPCRPSAAAAGV